MFFGKPIGVFLFFIFLWIPTSYHEIFKKNHNVFNVGKARPFGLYPTLNFPIDDGIESFFKNSHTSLVQVMGPRPIFGVCKRA